MTSRQRHPLVVLEGMSRTFGGDEAGGARDLDVSIEAGEFVAIVGPSGAGKTTLLNVLGLLDRPESGRYLLDGVDTGTLSERQRNVLRSRSLGFVFQSSFVLGDATVAKNAAMGLRIRRVPFRERRDRTAHALQRIGIAARSDLDARLLSGGERQRLATARAIAPGPELLLADEPTGNLDSANSHRVLDHLRQLNSSGTTVILITHDPEVAARADRRIRIADGRVESDDGGSRQSREGREGQDPASRGGDVDRVPARRRPAIAAMDDVGEAITTLSSRLLRTALLVVAFALGIGGLIASLGVSESASAQVSQRLSAAALDEVRVILPGGPDLLRDGSDLERWLASARALPHVVDAGYVAQVGATSARIRRLHVDDGGASVTPQLIAASPEYLRMMGARTEGSDGASLLDDGIPAIALVGDAIAAGLAVAAPGPGSSLWINDRRVSVVGILAAGARSPAIADTIVVSPDVVAASASASVSLVLRTEPGYPAAVADAVPVALDPVDPGRFGVETVADLRQLRYGVASDLGALIGLTAVVLLALATISASTTMYLSVQSRAHEIALRRAIGASRTAVARIFLVEGAVVGVVGGAVGAVVGTAATIAAARAQSWTPVLDAGLVPLGILLGTVTGVLSAIVPAWSAGRQEPALAIRG